MSLLEEIRDPIVRIYAIDLLERYISGLGPASRSVYTAARSLRASPRFTTTEKAEADDRITRIERVHRSLYRFFDQSGATQSHDFAKMLSALHAEWIENAQFFVDSRGRFPRYTSVDENILEARRDYGVLGQEVKTLTLAINDNDEDAIKKIYQEIVGGKLEQLDAPYLFDVVNSIVGLTNPPTVDQSQNAKEGLAILVKEASDLAGRLVQTNIDRRFISAVGEYIDALTEPNFSPIKVDLFSNKLRYYLIEMRDELPGFAVAELSALLLSQERVLRQFPSWRDFENDASKYTPDDQTASKQRELLEKIASTTRETAGVATDEVLAALGRLEESSSDKNLQGTGALGVWRSVENFLKTNIRHVIQTAKSLQSNLSVNQTRYIRYLKRLLPYLKLYVAMDERRAWLRPVIQWLEDTLKSLEK